MFRDGRVTDMSVKEAMRRSLEPAKNLERIALGKGVSIVEPFAGTSAFGNRVLVVGPPQAYYESLLPDFRCTPVSADTRTSLAAALLHTLKGPPATLNARC